MREDDIVNIKNIKLKAKQNIRDFSYITNKDNYALLGNSFLRSNNINIFDKDDINFLKSNYNLKTIIDLRNKDEVVINPCKIDNIKYYNIPLFESRKRNTFSNSLRKQTVSKVPNIYEAYLDMIRTKTAKKQLKKIFKILMNQKNNCILFHCTFGKDRTGLISLLLLSMLDVDIDTIKKDYLYSNNYLESIADEKYKYYLEKSRNEEYALQMRDIFLVKEEFIDYIIDYMIKENGSIIDYIKKELGVSEKRIVKFKNNVLYKIDK